MPSEAPKSFSVVVVGGGVGGLAVSILLAQAGHQVTIIENKNDSFESQNPGGLNLTWNSVRWIHAMGLEHELAHIADTSYNTLMMKYDTGETMTSIERPLPFSMVHRADVMRMLYEFALKSGVKVRFRSTVASVADSANQPTVMLSDGTELKCDIVVGADGIHSVVRRAVFPDISQRLSPMAVMLVSIPESIMEQNPAASEVYHTPPSLHISMAPARMIVSYTMSKRQSYFLQMCDFEYENGKLYSLEDPPNGPYIATVTDNSGLRKRWSDHAPHIQHIVNSISSFVKWKIAEMPPLPRYSSSSGRIIILGDAAHALKPFAGQGANMAIEDAKTLSTLLSLLSSKDEIPDMARVYDAARIGRLAGIREIVEMNVQTFGTKDNELQKRRDKELAESRKQGHNSDGMIAEESKWKGSASAEWDKWIKEYDAESEAQEAWAEFRTGKHGA